MQDEHTHWVNTYQAVDSVPLLLHRSHTKSLGGLLPSTVAVREVSSVLDVGCSDGGWVLDVATRYPHMFVRGIDIDEVALERAHVLQRLNERSNAQFQRMDATQPLAFASNSFDLVHVRSAPFLLFRQWPQAMKEFLRVLRPGGWLNVIEYEHGATSSTALNQIAALVVQVLYTLRRVDQQQYEIVLLSSTEKKNEQKTLKIPGHLHVAPYLYKFFLDAYLVDISYSVHTVDIGYGSAPGGRAMIQQILIAAEQFKPLLLQHNIIQSDSYDALVKRARQELQQPHSCGFGYFVSAVGRKDE